MSFFENLGKKISQAGGSAVEKTKQMTEIARLNGKIDDTQKNLDKLYKQIGEIYAEKYSDIAPEDLVDYISQVKNYQTELDNLGKELNLVKGFVKCDNCGSLIKIGDAFCGKCGEAAPMVERPVKENDTPACPKCGKELDDEAKFCPECGANIEEEKKALGFEEEIEETEVVDVKLCPKCNTTVKEDAHECPACGEKLEDDKEA